MAEVGGNRRNETERHLFGDTDVKDRKAKGEEEVEKKIFQYGIRLLKIICLQVLCDYHNRRKSKKN